MISADLGRISVGDRATGRAAAGARCELREPLQMRRLAALGQSRPRRAPCARHDACRSSTRACGERAAQAGPFVTAHIERTSSSHRAHIELTSISHRRLSHSSQLAIRRVQSEAIQLARGHQVRPSHLLTPITLRLPRIHHSRTGGPHNPMSQIVVTRAPPPAGVVEAREQVRGQEVRLASG